MKAKFAWYLLTFVALAMGIIYFILLQWFPITRIVYLEGRVASLETLIKQTTLTISQQNRDMTAMAGLLEQTVGIIEASSIFNKNKVRSSEYDIVIDCKGKRCNKFVGIGGP